MRPPQRREAAQSPYRGGNGQGLSSTSSLVVAPDGVTVSFAVPANAKNCVIWDELVGTGAGAKGFLYWAKKAQTNNETDPGGSE